ncbi:HAD-IA family hydrolase [Streptomyces sp. NPDC002838]|uniref:HAD-IA family hydrolase n=1 Tax=Streptomyces sp. NPDC002838 TaxID=3154436 RepID=UPI0033321072
MHPWTGSTVCRPRSATAAAEAPEAAWEKRLGHSSCAHPAEGQASGTGSQPEGASVGIARHHDFFDAVVLSELEGVRKPSPLIYRRALEALDLSGPECVFVDDHARNLPPAEALGIRTVHHTTDPAATAALLDSLLRDREPA